ncbi:hypothetical protein [Lysinibacillus fusiformis]|uniref:hypothetical protein n=1 Tax=Lysinibacillus fusiformis TaxID=28031 RepID=UPI0034E234E5
MKKLLLSLTMFAVAMLFVLPFNNASASIFGGNNIAQITNIKSTNGGYVDLGFGKAYRGSTFITVEGILKDSYGDSLANKSVSITMVRKINNTPVVGTGTTDANGRFSIQMNIKSAVGEYEANGRRFDVIPVSASSGGQTIQCSESIFYHNAF